jgi:hypothetical protein
VHGDVVKFKLKYLCRYSSGSVKVGLRGVMACSMVLNGSVAYSTVISFAGGCAVQM